jgi:hypothetical protein
MNIISYYEVSANLIFPLGKLHVTTQHNAIEWKQATFLEMGNQFLLNPVIHAFTHPISCKYKYIL